MVNGPNKMQPGSAQPLLRNCCGSLLFLLLMAGRGPQFVFLSEPYPYLDLLAYIHVHVPILVPYDMLQLALVLLFLVFLVLIYMMCLLVVHVLCTRLRRTAYTH